jgi:diguanylate cyclase (GGDEF)-like protein
MNSGDEQKERSRQLTLIDLPGSHKRVPLRALVLGIAALITAVVGAFTNPTALAGYDALSWLLILIPAFLLSYYRGWRGATRALAGGALLILVAELFAERVLALEVEWVFLFLIALVLLSVGLGLGVLSELLRRERETALVMAYSDPLTGLPNRRLLEFTLSKEFAAAQRGRDLTVVMFDIDGFKRYNDERGHKAGDVALTRVAAVLDRNTRYMNMTGRYGGEEFLAILSGERVEGAMVFTERTREAVASTLLPEGTTVTVSCGIATYRPWMGRPGDLVDAADQALRRAKENGGNCTLVHERSEENAEVAHNDATDLRSYRDHWSLPPEPQVG